MLLAAVLWACAPGAARAAAPASVSSWSARARAALDLTPLPEAAIPSDRLPAATAVSVEPALLEAAGAATARGAAGSPAGEAADLLRSEPALSWERAFARAVATRQALERSQRELLEAVLEERAVDEAHSRVIQAQDQVLRLSRPRWQPGASQPERDELLRWGSGGWESLGTFGREISQAGFVAGKLHVLSDSGLQARESGGVWTSIAARGNAASSFAELDGQLHMFIYMTNDIYRRVGGVWRYVARPRQGERTTALFSRGGRLYAATESGGVYVMTSRWLPWNWLGRRWWPARDPIERAATRAAREIRRAFGGAGTEHLRVVETPTAALAWSESAVFAREAGVWRKLLERTRTPANAIQSVATAGRLLFLATSAGLEIAPLAGLDWRARLADEIGSALEKRHAAAAASVVRPADPLSTDARGRSLLAPDF